MLRFSRLILITIFSCIVAAVPAETLKHTVQPGETLYGIARRYNVPLEALMSANRIRDQKMIQPGLTLALPDKPETLGEYREYTVQKGDSLYGLAKKTGVPIKTILAINKLKLDSLLKPGDKVKLEKIEAIPPRKVKDTPAGSEAGPGKMNGAPTEKPGSPQSVHQAFFWPHSGNMKELEGKLVGVTFTGRQGDPVYSISSGQIVWIGPYRGYGKVVFVQSELGYIYVYAGNEELAVRQGETVAPGKRLGALGVNPYEQNSTLYLIVYKDGQPVRPREAPRI
jgi:lipoprotein YgeR